MKKSIKGFAMGLIAGLVISCICVGAFRGVVQKELSYNDIKITLNGQAITPKDANGNVVEPFIIDGTTYLPVRAIANALGLDVNWDGETNTVKLGKDSANSSGVPTGAGSVIFDKNGVKITYNGCAVNGTRNEYKLLIENNTNEAVHVHVDKIYANGFAMERGTDFGVLIEPGRKAVEAMAFQEYYLKQCGITQVENIEFELMLNLNYDATEKVIFNP